MAVSKFNQLPDELIKNVLSYWSPKMAHKQRIYEYLNKIYDELCDIDYKQDNDYYVIPPNKIKLYVNLYNKLPIVDEIIEYVKITENRLIVKTRQRNHTLHYYLKGKTTNEYKKTLQTKEALCVWILDDLRKYIWNNIEKYDNYPY